MVPFSCVAACMEHAAADSSKLAKQGFIVFNYAARISCTSNESL